MATFRSITRSVSPHLSTRRKNYVERITEVGIKHILILSVFILVMIFALY